MPRLAIGTDQSRRGKVPKGVMEIVQRDPDLLEVLLRFSKSLDLPFTWSDSSTRGTAAGKDFIVSVVEPIGRNEIPITLFEIEVDETKTSSNRLLFHVACETHRCQLALHLAVQRGYEVRHVAGDRFMLKAGRLEMSLESYLSDYPPLIKFADMSELDGNLLVKPQDVRELVLPGERFEPWDWTGVDITSESTWKAGKKRASSIQGHVASKYAAGGFTIIFDDDAKGEAADLICLKDVGETILLALVHCKFSKGKDAGERVGDVVEVCSQAIRSAKWKWRFRELVRHILLREKRLKKPNRNTRFLAPPRTSLARRPVPVAGWR